MQKSDNHENAEYRIRLSVDPCAQYTLYMELYVYLCFWHSKVRCIVYIE